VSGWGGGVRKPLSAMQYGVRGNRAVMADGNRGFPREGGIRQLKGEEKYVRRGRKRPEMGGFKKEKLEEGSGEEVGDKGKN